MNKEDFKDYCNELDDVLKIVFKFIAIICTISLCAAIIDYNFNKDKHNDNTIEVNQVQKSNDSLKVLINNLDSIKDAKIIEVETLDNDSTIKLFYNYIK